MKWEYHLVTVQADSSADLLTALNEAGNDGWELATMDAQALSEETMFFGLVFKRMATGIE